MSTHDAIILGSGHNSLILQAYLARAGLDTLCIESRDSPGGGLTTVQWPAGSGFFHNTHSFFHRGITSLPWYDDLDLLDHGAQYVQPPLNVAMICSDGRTLQWWSDFERTEASFAQVSASDAKTMRRWREEFIPIVRRILDPEARSAPMQPLERRRFLMQSSLGRTLLETSARTPLEFVTREFQHPAVQAALLFFNGLREVDLRLPGFGHHIPALLASDRMAQMCLGGSARLAEALIATISNSGGSVITDVNPRRIVVENGRAAGVETSDGDLVRAKKLIASGLNPQQTFLDLIDANHLPRDWRQQARDYTYNLLAPLFSLNVNLTESPKYAATEHYPELTDALMVIVGIDDASRFHEIVHSHDTGGIPPTVMWGSNPTRFDPSQAPPGCHTAFMWEKLPYQLRGDARNWDAERHRHAESMIQTWNQYAPNLSESMIEWFASTPLDTERKLPNMRQGDLLVGSFDHGQVGYHRPFPGAGHYRGHLPGLYLCGSCCHPGGNITGLPGYNAAQVILSDLGIAVPWARPPLHDTLSKLKG